MGEKMGIPLSRPDLGEREKRAVLEVLETPDLSLGPRQTRFEGIVRRFTGSSHAMAVSSGTAGLHLCIRATGIGAGHEVLTTPYSFVASSNALLYEGALPAFVDVDPMDGNLDPEKVVQHLGKDYGQRKEGLVNRHTGRTLKGLLVVHVFGAPCDMGRILDIGRDYDLPVIEDACEALGARYRRNGHWVHVGTEGVLGVFAFYPNKQITTGEGGMVITQDEGTAREILMLRNQGRSLNTRELEHVRLGYNYRLDEISAALGSVQMERIEEILKARDAVARLYHELLQEMDEVEPMGVRPDTQKSWFVYVVRTQTEEMRDRVMERLRDRGIGTRVYFRPIHLQPYYRDRFGYGEGDYPATEALSRTSLALPFYTTLSGEDQRTVIETVKEAVTRRG
jgi:perosamine synthetase